MTEAVTNLMSCSAFGPWHALTIVGVAFAVAWVLVTLLKA